MKNTVRKVYWAFMALLFHIFRLFPVRKDSVFFSTFNGMRYADNCRAIAEALHDKKPGIRMYWARSPHAAYDLPSWLTPVSSSVSIRKIHAMATSRVWVTTHLFEIYTRKRNSQYYINTWHGGLGIKAVGTDTHEEPHFGYNEFLRRNMAMVDLMISNSGFLTKVEREALHYSGPIENTGYPKNDILFKDPAPLRQKVLSYYRLPPEKKLLLYAPTYRDGLPSSGEIFDLDIPRLKEALHDRFQEDYLILIRWHPALLELPVAKEEIPGAVNVTDYPDMQELLCAADICISDYSSCLFDAALRRIPCLMFVVDYEEYKEKRGVYLELSELPFPAAKSSYALQEVIRSYDHEAYLKRWDQFMVEQDVFENGHAADAVADHILQVM